MHVLTLGWEFPPYRSGGLGTYLYGLTRGLHALGHAVTFVMPSTGAPVSCGFARIVQVPAARAARPGSALSVPLPYASGATALLEETGAGGGRALLQRGGPWREGFFARVAAYNRGVLEAANGLAPDLIHAHDWMTYPAGAALAKKTGAPLVVSLHSTEYDRTADHPNPLVASIERAGLHAADYVVAVSQRTRRQLVARYGVPEDKVRVLYAGLDHEAFCGPAPRRPRDEYTVLFVGRLTVQKGPDYFLHAAKQVLEALPRTRFVVVGCGDMLPLLLRQAIALGIMDQVTFTGFEDAVPRYYAAADVFVMPSVSEPFGLAALEAAACGTPVILSRQSGALEVLRNVLRVDFWDTRALAEKIAGLLAYPPARSALSRHVLAEARRYPSWKDAAAGHAALYEEVLAR